MKVTAAITLTLTHDDGSTITVTPAPTTRVYDLSADWGISQGELLSVVHDALSHASTFTAGLLVNAAGQTKDTSPVMTG